MIAAFDQLWYGLTLAAQPHNLFYALIGSLLGTLVGVLPGLGPVTTIAVLLPVTYQVGDPLGAIIMLASIYYGAMYGGSTTSILLKVPGEAASVITCIDGYEMARQGRAGPALAISAIGSFIAGTVAVFALAFVGPAFAAVALTFGPPEYFALAVFGLALSSTLTSGSPVRGMVMVLVGVLLGSVGVDTVTGVYRYTFGSLELADGIELVPMLMGLFGIGEILYNLEQRGVMAPIATKIRHIMPTRQDWAESWPAIARGSIFGFMIGLIPGGGAILGSLLSYTVEKKLSRTPEKFGKGAIAGVAGPESANNSAASASFIPLLTLGLPGNAVTAVLFAGLLIQNVTPGPLMMTKNPEVFWGVIASMYFGNLILLVLNLPMVGLWVQLLRLPFWVLGTSVLVISIFGAYSLRNDWFDVGLLMVSGAIGYVFRKANLDSGPLVMAFILANILDTSLRQSLLMGDGNISIMVTRPISGIILAVAAIVVVTQIYGYVVSDRRKHPPALAADP
jgi:putative tricarboxylic transport membrane protein